MSTRAEQVLNRPLTLGSAKIPNRIAMAPMTRMHSPGGIPGPDVAAYYARRAAAGTGLIITEGTYIGHPTAGESDQVPRFAGTEQRSEEHTSELQSRGQLVCRLLLEQNKY